MNLYSTLCKNGDCGKEKFNTLFIIITLKLEKQLNHMADLDFKNIKDKFESL
jgi:hypothetical protein